MASESPTAREICDAFVSAARHTLSEGMRKIEHCTEQLTDDQLWWRPRPEMNSIANLLLHLSGNLRQWIVAGVGNAEDIRNRPMEFADRSHRPKTEILDILAIVVSDADDDLACLTPEHLSSRRRIQGYDTTVLAAIADTVAHFRGHVQEIIHMTRQQLGEKYRFDFVPKGKEQESAGP
ncbi:MAG TPA: DUF1572 family protein [Tepidisphaeraceae bacterium]|jgi:hypothetical protein|nr:DUF1572 family protein [Tepidisphaeraceae bacterium]